MLHKKNIQVIHKRIIQVIRKRTKGKAHAFPFAYEKLLIKNSLNCGRTNWVYRLPRVVNPDGEKAECSETEIGKY